MNVTFLIGNGFDINLGLDTRYSDFVKVYKNMPANQEVIKKFRKNISENSELWADAEIALGEYTNNFKAGEGALFSECKEDFCVELSRYLKNQELRIEYDISKEAIQKAFLNLNKITNPFPTLERDLLNRTYQSHLSEPVKFNFINFNYTKTLDMCIKTICNIPNIWGTHMYNSRIIDHKICQEVIHVHGTVDKEMILGVNDKSQILNTEIFNCEDGEIYERFLIKQLANNSYMENTDLKAASLMQGSNILYIYGMSIGETDKLWWDRICKWLDSDEHRHLIIHNFNMPPKGITQVRYQLAIKRYTNDFINYYDKQSKTRKNLENQIHITGENIFQDITGIADIKSTSINNETDIKTDINTSMDLAIIKN